MIECKQTDLQAQVFLMANRLSIDLYMQANSKPSNHSCLFWEQSTLLKMNCFAKNSKSRPPFIAIFQEIFTKILSISFLIFTDVKVIEDATLDVNSFGVQRLQIGDNWSAFESCESAWNSFLPNDIEICQAESEEKNFAPFLMPQQPKFSMEFKSWTILKEDHQRKIPVKFGWNWPYLEEMMFKGIS